MKPPKLKVKFDCPVFPDYTAPLGWLNTDLACQALWYYFIVAQKNWGNEKKGGMVVLEGEEDPTFNYRQLMMSIATMYGEKPEKMITFWRNVDMQAQQLGLDKLPMEERYRFTAVPEIKTQ